MDHRLPPWVNEGATFFVTINAEKRGPNQFCKSEIGPGLLDSIQHYHESQKWFCSVALLMPDHVHLLVSTSREQALAKTIGAWKRWTAREYGIDWQRNFFDHRLRAGDRPEAKRHYIAENPVRAGLVDKGGDWPWIWSVTG